MGPSLVLSLDLLMMGYNGHVVLDLSSDVLDWESVGVIM